ADNCNIGVFGTIGKRVTVVASCPAGDKHANSQCGIVRTAQDIVYKTGNFSTATQFFTIVAMNIIDSQNYNDGELEINGMLYTEDGPTPWCQQVTLGGNKDRYYRFYGMDKAGTTFGAGGAKGNIRTADPGMAVNVPYGTPRKPMLVNINYTAPQ